MLELINTLAHCQSMCNHCFNACLGEEDVHMMAKCIKLDKDCSDICGSAISFVSSDSSLAKGILKICAEACQSCADECKKHQVLHCQECAKACQKCADACKTFI